MALAVLGVATLVVGLLFAFLTHEDIRQADRWEEPLVGRAEQAGDHEQVESIELVFDTERAKLRGERRMWLWVIAGGGVGGLFGLGVSGLAPLAFRSAASNRSSHRG